MPYGSPVPRLENPLLVLVAEDEYFIAMDLVEKLQAIGAEVLAVKGTLSEVRRLVQTSERIDVALLDIDLRGELIYPVADELIARGVPIVFATSCNPTDIPPRYAGIARCEKPVCPWKLAQAVRGAVAGLNDLADR